MMRIEPHQISHRLAAMLLKVGRGDLTRTGFDFHEDALERSKRHESDPDRALFHALFDKGAPHNAPGLIGGVKAWAQEVSYVQFMLTVLVVLVAAQSARCQPSQNLVVRGQNGSTTQFTRSAGLLDFKCDGTTVICSWNSTTSTWTITAAGGGGGTPGGANCDVQYNNSGAFGGALNFCFDPLTGFVGIGTSTPTAALDVVNPDGTANSTAIRMTGNIPTFFYHDTNGADLPEMNISTDSSQGPVVNFIPGPGSGATGAIFYMIAGEDPINSPQVGVGMSGPDDFVFTVLQGAGAVVPMLDFAAFGANLNAVFARFDTDHGGLLIGKDLITSLSSASPADGLEVEGDTLLPSQAASTGTPATLCINNTGKIVKGTTATCTGT